MAKRNFSSLAKRKAARTVFTIGYEGRGPEEVIALLRKHAIECLLDVRYRPQSRKRGLSKSTLSEALRDQGLDYAHERGLGTPPAMMREIRERGHYDWDDYRGYLLAQEDALERAAELVTTRRTCLLCYEADAGSCHRHVVADELGQRTGLDVMHLGSSQGV